MEKDYLSREEDERFSRTVIDFNNTDNDKVKENEKNAIRERTKILIYIVAREILHLSTDDASTVFLEMEKELDKIISQYKVSNATFNQYLKQLCQYRCRRIKHKAYQNTLWESAYFMEEAKYNAKSSWDFDSMEVIRNNDENRQINKDLYSDFNMINIVDFISKNKNVPDYPIFNNMEGKLRKALNKTSTRKRFLIFILSLPRKTEGFDSYDIARVMQTDEWAISRFLDLKDDALGYQEDKIREIQSRASKHWRIMAKLVANINLENDDEKRRKLRDHYHTQVMCHKKNVIQIKKASCGMSRASIANILEVSRSSVSTAIKEISMLLEMIAKS